MSHKNYALVRTSMIRSTTDVYCLFLFSGKHTGRGQGVPITRIFIYLGLC